ncbi:hypothetical protein GTNG_2816 [Geobacillus thermodenitrificans NG80-2]|jgi:hypothetical protein|uniref:Uncharacterized protein n=1 Tax=Geobacillus thermodenitrificans (strain NG80-2) TaxID=420246 RepID=A4IS57_GEOTN|nr:hypothetical protein GTNG_2816 [Geobacillus thermodenitrificans NG80-2]MED0662192.1 hypothetical protein [Geobacillus thermodenitrificans]
MTIPFFNHEGRNFYFLVKECGVSPLDVPYMTPLQQEVLIAHHNKIQKECQKEIEKLRGKLPKRARLRKGR